MGIKQASSSFTIPPFWPLFSSSMLFEDGEKENGGTEN
jgi:hypothetical protein